MEQARRVDPYERAYARDLAWQRRGRRTAASVAKTVVTLLAFSLPAAFAVMLALGLNVNVIVTGSMEPALPVGSLVLYETVAPDELNPGDVISFERPRGDRAITTHRIVTVDDRDGSRVFQTKGDNNPVADPWLIRYGPEHEPKRMIAAVPHVGQVLLATQAPLAKAIAIVLALGFVYLTFLRTLVGGSAARQT